MGLRISLKLSISTLIVALLLSHVLYIAFAASGGRMGGSSFKSRSKSSSRSSSYHSRHYHHSTTVYNNYHTPSQTYKNYEKGEDFSIWHGVFLATFLVGVFSLLVFPSRGTVLRVQIGLSGKARTLQRDLNAIAKTTDTSSLEGWNHILTETTLALLRHPDYYISGYSYVVKGRSNEDLEERFKKLCSEEREKFDVESLVNVNNIKMQRAVIPKAKEVGKDSIVVTILVAAQGGHKLPAIRSTEDLNEALQYLSVISSSKLMGVEVLWTPQDENDSLSVDELLENYPLLRPI